MNTQKVDFVIVGAGMAGTVLERFLRDHGHDIVLLDPKPASYKIGESIIPEHFHHPVLRELVPRARKLPSYSPKWGSTFVSRGSVASFPLPEHGAEVAMHVARTELEALMHDAWQTPIVREAAREVDLGSRTVSTSTHHYVARKQIIDCSGPAMVVGRQLGIDALWPVYARWAYYDVEAVDDAAFWSWIAEDHLDYRRYDIPKARLLPGSESQGWRPSHSTVLTELEPGLWTWQIPMYGHRLLSFGVVSKHGPVSEDQLRTLARTTHAPQYTLAARAAGDDWRDRSHVRNGFARKARVSATADVVLLADASAFADPIYSVGTGLAVNKAIELASILNEEGWTEHSRARWTSAYDRLIGRAVTAFETWYDGSLLRDDQAAQEVQRGFLVGTAFQTGIAIHYQRQIVDAGPPLSEPGPGGRGRHVVDSTQPHRGDVEALLGLAPGQRLAGWVFDGAWSTSAGEVQHRWTRSGVPQLIVNTSFDPANTRYFRRVGDVSLSFMNLLEEPYPLDAAGEALFDALEHLVREHQPEWEALGRGSGSTGLEPS